MAEYRAGRIEDFADPGVRVARAGSQEIAVFRLGDRLYALDNFCVHLGGPLAEGLLEDGCIECPWHGWRFRLEDGARTGLGHLGVASYPVRVEDGEVWVQVDRPDRRG